MDKVDALATCCAVGLLSLAGIGTLAYLMRDLWADIRGYSIWRQDGGEDEL